MSSATAATIPSKSTSGTTSSGAARVLDPPVGVKVLGGILAGCLGMVLITATALISLGDLKDRGEGIHDVSMVTVSRLETIRRLYLQTRIDAFADDMLATGDGDAEHVAYVADVKAMEEAIAQFGKLSLTAAQRSALDHVDKVWTTYTGIVGGKLLQVARTGNKDAYIQLRDTEVKPLAKEMNSAMDQLVDAVDEQTKAVLAQNTSTYNSARIETIAVFLLSSLVALALG
ncbi:MAG: methyl-accepting chemotaxis protein, partial [Actinomycetota bacterium]|nr:methyl-accepting chemotaxis protein [Actinomycetota bacterium]